MCRTPDNLRKSSGARPVAGRRPAAVRRAGRAVLLRLRGRRQRRPGRVRRRRRRHLCGTAVASVEPSRAAPMTAATAIYSATSRGRWGGRISSPMPAALEAAWPAIRAPQRCVPAVVSLPGAGSIGAAAGTLRLGNSPRCAGTAATPRTARPAGGCRTEVFVGGEDAARPEPKPAGGGAPGPSGPRLEAVQVVLSVNGRAASNMAGGCAQRRGD